MHRSILTPLVIVGLLFLPSCSSAEKKVCEAASQAKIDYQINANFHWGNYQKLIKSQANWGESYNKAIEAQTNSQRVVVNNPKCFTPAQVAEAQTYISRVK